MAFLDLFLAAVLLILLVIAARLYVKTEPKQVVSPLKCRPPVPIKWEEPILSEYQPIADALKASIDLMKRDFSSEFLQELENVYVSARFSDVSIGKENGMMAEKGVALAEAGKSLQELGARLDCLKSVTGSTDDVQSIIADKIVDYLIESKNNQREVIDLVGEMFAINERGLEDLKRNGPRLAATYLRAEDAAKKMALRTGIHDSLDSAEKYLIASGEKYDSLKAESARPPGAKKARTA
ncbi:MAG: hypothetical protein V1875_01870 [Candidatus Altiarchaeota archaeon]